MSYVPLNRIKTNLISNGEFTLSTTGKSYYGTYHSLFNGKYFTGKNQNDFPILELYKINPSTNIPQQELIENEVPVSTLSNSNQIFKYINLEQNEIIPKLLPYLYLPKITEEDIQLGEFTRYFTKKTNENIYTEIDVTSYNQFSTKNSNYFWEIYELISTPWEIKGDINNVYKVNKNIVELWEQQNNQPSLGAYLRYNYIEFYIYDEKDNQYTSGNEFVGEMGNNYIGYFIFTKIGALWLVKHIQTYPIQDYFIKTLLTIKPQKQPTNKILLDIKLFFNTFMKNKGYNGILACRNERTNQLFN